MLPIELDCPLLKFLYLRGKAEVEVPDGFFEKMEKLEVLEMVKMELSELSISLLALVQLRTLILKSCKLRDMSTNVSTQIDDAFPCLEILHLSNVFNLEKICGVNVGNKSFGQLTRIHICSCHQLKNIFPLSIVKQLSLLEEIEVDFCRNLESIFVVDSLENADIDEVSLEQLSSLTLRNLPGLKRIFSGGEEASSSNASSSQIVMEEEDQSLFGEKVQKSIKYSQLLCGQEMCCIILYFFLSNFTIFVKDTYSDYFFNYN